MADEPQEPKPERDWPRGDARFVGKWEVSFYDQESRLNRTLVLVLKSNGLGETYGKVRRGGDFAWEVRGKVFRQGSPTTSRIVNDAIASVQRQFPTDYIQVNIVSVDADEIEMSTESGSRIVFKRIPE
ncbi:hypothetical protein Pan44_07540 [Caulifigura coniformis]|uniref:META domain protein n=1 Tax=Caulifigura coniformis TaxID=2527983 RepID=A0A517S9F7_9PLAN|nr:hypothetical protein [Caulifigura coniformis]QDT52742.1 hypothetical protein Pan44_07540 [Caulifigura coniformis]